MWNALLAGVEQFAVILPAIVVAVVVRSPHVRPDDARIINPSLADFVLYGAVFVIAYASFKRHHMYKFARLAATTGAIFAGTLLHPIMDSCAHKVALPFGMGVADSWTTDSTVVIEDLNASL